MTSTEKIITSSRFGSDNIIILGSGGGRYHAASQRRSTGGFVLRILNGKIQCHIDPGPGAIRDIRDWKINARTTQYIFLTHAHVDHNNDIPILVEAIQDDMTFKEKKGTLVAPMDYIESGQISKYHQSLLQRIMSVETGKTYDLEAGFRITTTSTNHLSPVQNVGFIMEIGPQNGINYKIAFTSDTAVFPEYVNTYKGVDILIANVLRPDDKYCRGHLCIDEFIPLLKEINPKLCILVHFGARMDDDRSGDNTKTQEIKLQKAVGEKIRVIAAADGQKITFA